MAANFPGFSRLGGDTFDYARAGGKKSESAPELLYKMCKKIAQLTKVVYVLNTRNDDLEMQCKSAAEATEERVSSATADLKRTVSQLKAELEKKIDLNDRVKGLEETLKRRDQELRKLLDEIATVRKRQEERERELSCAYIAELREATEAKQSAERRLAEAIAARTEERANRRREHEGTSLSREKSEEKEPKDEKRSSLEEEETEEERRKRGGAEEGRKRVQEVAEFRRLVEQLQKDLKEKTERWEAVAKEERSKLEAQLERAKTAKEDAEKLLAQQLQAESPAQWEDISRGHFDPTISMPPSTSPPDHLNLAISQQPSSLPPHHLNRAIDQQSSSPDRPYRAVSEQTQTSTQDHPTPSCSQTVSEPSLTPQLAEIEPEEESA